MNVVIYNTELIVIIRTDMNVVFGDIDTLKKDKQDNYLQIEQLKRQLNQGQLYNITLLYILLDLMTSHLYSYLQR